jgi:hypothetical protein
LITQQTLEQHKASLALVVALMAQRFGTPTDRFQSGTEEEYNWALESFRTRGFPHVKWFFRDVSKLVVPTEPTLARSAIEQWEKVLRFREQVEQINLSKTFVDLNNFCNVFRRDVAHWLNNTVQPWNSRRG